MLPLHWGGTPRHRPWSHDYFDVGMCERLFTVSLARTGAMIAKNAEGWSWADCVAATFGVVGAGLEKLVGQVFCFQCRVSMVGFW